MFNNNVADNKQRKSQSEREANDFQWYKDQANMLDSRSFGGSSNFVGFGDVSEFKRKKVNYDLFNNIINVEDFTYVCKPYGAGTGELPANLANRDIVSGKIKVLLGMEMKMPFSWKVVAVNPEATTRREQKEAEMLRDFVIGEIMRPIKADIKKQHQEQVKGRDLTPQEQEQVNAQVEQETQARTPDEVRKYMLREHQDPAEIMAHQILEYLIQKEKVNDKFNKGWKHSNLSGEEIYCVAILNGEHTLKVVNPLYFDYDKSPDIDYIEDGEWAVAEYRMTPSEIVANFGSQLTNDEIDRVYDITAFNGSGIKDSDFTFKTDGPDEPFTIRVKHCTWKSLRKVGFLKYISSKTGKEEMDIVDENYKLKKDQGDISIEWDYIPESHETYKILNDIFCYMRPVPGQHKDLDNLYSCKLPYYGAACDSLNSPTTAPMDRMKAYQYFYNVLVYRVELLMASDKGKILAVNINAIPKSAGINIKKFQYFLEANKIAFLNPNEEGNKGTDVTNMVKEVDMSLATQIDKYIQLAEYIERKCGGSVGVTPQMEAQIQANEAVSNTRQNLVQSSHIIQPYFELHNIVKGNVLTALLESAKVAYATGKPRKLSYILDDMSVRMFEVDQGLLDSSTLGLFISNSSKAADAKQAVENLAQAALQNQQASLSDIIKVIRSESVTEAEELLDAAAQKAADNLRAVEQEKIKAQKELDARQDARDDKKYAHEERMIVVKEKERRETEIQKQTILSAGFNEDKDLDDDGEPDVLEIAKFGIDADIKARKQNLDEQKFEHQKRVDDAKIKIENKKANQKPKTGK